MAGKVVLITGASSGLGEVPFCKTSSENLNSVIVVEVTSIEKLIAYEYAKRGARLAIIAREKLESRLKEVADRARQLGSPDVLFMYADVSKVDECRKFVDATIQRFGQLDHLVCNAGIGSTYSANTDITKFEAVMDINFWGSVYPTHFAIPYLKSSHGKIIVNASSAGLFHPPNGGFYNASKAALISFYESLRYEVFPSVTITILTLGFIQTNFITAKNLANSVGLNLRKDIGAVAPAMGAEACAKAIVDGVCKGASSIMEPRSTARMLLGETAESRMRRD
nr:11-beta-hydroxysteroid dehydrogenase-like 4A [Tanacetum cinerariifolium]